MSCTMESTMNAFESHEDHKTDHLTHSTLLAAHGVKTMRTNTESQPYIYLNT